MSPAAAPRIDPHLVHVIRHSPANASAAEVTRAVGDVAWTIGLARPSYEQVRTILRETRWESERVSDWDVLYDIASGLRPATDLPNRWYGDPLPWRQSAKNEPRKSK